MPHSRWRWAASALLAGVLLLGLSQVLDRRASTPLDAAFQRALITFAVVRGINAVVSVVQGTEIAIEPGGVGVVLTPGEVFDPINDLIERFSWIMLASSTSLGAQKVLVEVGQAALLQVLMVAALGVLAWLLWRERPGSARLRAMLLRLALLVLYLRFAVPLTVLLSDAIYEGFLADRYGASQLVLETTREQVEALSEADEVPPVRADPGLLDRLGQWYDRAASKLDVQARIALYKDRLARASEHIIDMIVVFMLQTVVLPLLFLWLGLALLRTLTRGGG
jgi:hypothetical protein